MLSMASKQSRNQPKFTIEDAFEEDADDAIRIYGATNERSPLKPKARDAISRDSDSLIPGDSSSSFSESPRWWFLHPKVREKWRIVAGAFTLLIMGIILLITGIVVEAVPLESLSGPVFIIAGLICFIPGAYHVVYVLLAVWGRRGYDFYNLPLFN
ncbi:transmembrane protein 134-like isoform X2 [Homarus americanus]|uniref:transmembrane protein 134-like isoform X2 n=1 Tax=Homarus americanus TaxID=6706 RepID=UPI001C48BF96|nr:transmembrane protein 134-like isoform X2 [Homarus americanus]